MKVSVVSESEFTVQGHGVHTAYVELTNALRRRTDIDIAVNKRGPADITHLHTVGAYALGRLLFDRSKKIVSAHIVPASLVGSLVGAKFWLPLAKLYLRWFYNRADMLFAVSDETKRELEDLGVHKPIEVVYNLIDTSRYKNSPEIKAEARTELGFSEKDWIIVGAGQVQPRKRVDDFVKAANLNPDIKFVWVGGMPFGKLAADSGAMQEMIKTSPPNMIFTGVIDHEKVRAYYQASDVFWLPSNQETFGLVVVEAAAAGLPVILRDIPDYKETFANDALLVNDDTVIETLRKLRQDPEFYERAKSKANSIAMRYDSLVGAEKVVNIYKQLLDT